MLTSSIFPPLHQMECVVGKGMESLTPGIFSLVEKPRVTFRKLLECLIQLCMTEIESTACGLHRGNQVQVEFDKCMRFRWMRERTFSWMVLDYQKHGSENIQVSENSEEFSLEGLFQGLEIKGNLVRKGNKFG